MASNRFSLESFFVRLFFAFILVFATYNPSNYSFYHWISTGLEAGFQPLMAFSGIVLLIGWIVYIRATITSLGLTGLILAFAFFGTLLWMVIDWGIVPADSIQIITYIVLSLLSMVLAIGMSWSHIRRRMSGQVDVNETDEELN
ncbi:MAG: hypothetical protein KZQ64_12665 [gamma proteobacterium symbiont of Bathyaustriella thionipta]|nr:hypothetical protein [gamma proteobacterium symbiont of Bathyaustriella thionipta]MCU7948812.1 hypothetical protein [gamma proteobacterium symbiont of Bathyaustriella thionipta]MCU7954224.1 hypothetical protein [gamma proteobacterium symbiont of Bathyaustriella thionipta]MCU7955270.1 hypothetical protein [gamma proteobacterium symbiont of Bathyaustriella thionipta]MCU7966279.1 hypothetical protein [gamma proteobacterium symbiont of Bathyaustriella thionipta]